MLMRRPGPLVVDASLAMIGRLEAERRIADYNENHDPKSGEFVSGEGEGHLSELHSHDPNVQGTGAGFRGSLAKLEGNKNIKTPEMKAIANRYINSGNQTQWPIKVLAKTRSGALTEMEKHYVKQARFANKIR